MVRFILRSLIHLDLSFVHGNRYGSIFILHHVDIQLCQHHLLKMLCFPLYNFTFFVKIQVFIGVRIVIWVFNSLPLVNLSVFMPYQSVFISGALKQILMSRMVMTLEVSILYRIVLAIVVFLFFHEVEYCPFKVCEELYWDLMGIALQL